MTVDIKESPRSGPPNGGDPSVVKPLCRGFPTDFPGWGVIEVRDKAGSIFAKDGEAAVGVRCFDAPLVYKTREPKAAQRHSARGQRRVMRRRRQRMNAIRDLLHRNGILPDAKDDALALALRRI